MFFALLLPATLRAQTDVAADTLVATADQPMPFSIYVLARAYDDSVVVRWAPDEYVAWKFLNGFGYQLERVRRSDFTIDTLATNLRPLTRSKFISRFAENDSLAAAAVQLIFGQGKKPNETDANPETPGSIVELREEQQTLYGFAMLIAEQRSDVAEAMGLRFIDRTAERGEVYDYIVRPLVPDSILDVHAGIATELSLGNFRPAPYAPVVTDSIVPPRTVLLSWTADEHSLFDIERRTGDDGAWQRLNAQPYLGAQTDVSMSGPDFFFSDDVPTLGTYYYRLRAYDSFGDRTMWTEPYRVEVRDLEPPSIPVLDRIDILRPDSLVLARIVWHKDTLEEDLAGFVPIYYHELYTGGQWLPLIDTPLAATDTMCIVDVTGMQTGLIAVVAYDSSGNAGTSVPMTMRISDLEPPAVPTGLEAVVSPRGVTTLKWNRSPERDIMDYEIWRANALDHVFARVSPADLRDTTFVDTISVRANQRYIYYRIRATDWSGNSSALSEAIAVPVPDFSTPAVCRLDSFDVDTERVMIIYAASSEASVKTHRVLRRLEDETKWTLIAQIDADSLGPSHRFLIEDRPPYQQERRYYYAVETLSRLGVSSGLSPQQSVVFRGPRQLDVPLTLYAAYDEKNHETRLTWETGGIPTDSPYYYAVYRRGADKPDFKFLTSTPADKPVHTDYLQRTGTVGEYYVKIIFRDGRQSLPSNTVKVEGK